MDQTGKKLDIKENTPPTPVEDRPIEEIQS
jgi:hypothetical protein